MIDDLFECPFVKKINESDLSFLESLPEEHKKVFNDIVIAECLCEKKACNEICVPRGGTYLCQIYK